MIRGRWRRARLAGRVLRRLRRAGVVGARYDARAFQVRFTPSGEDVPKIIDLAPLRTTKKTDRKSIDAYVEGLLRSPGLPQSWEAVRPLLRPVLRGATPGDPLRRTILPFLSEYVVIDQPDTMTYVVADQLTNWPVTADEVFDAALANLTGAVLQGRATEPTIVQFIDDGDAYWTSHLLLPHWLERLAEQVGGVPVAFAPERGTLLVTADDSAHLPGLFERAEQIYVTSSRPITPMAYVSDEHGCPKPYAAPAGHRLHRAVRRAERVLALAEYARQAAGNPKMAELRLSAEDRSQALWPTNDATLLPAADEVLAGDVLHEWSSLLPHLTKAPGLDPPRWQATRWPA